MPMRGSGPTDLRVVDRFDGGFGWMAYPSETMQRTAHALSGEGGLWLVDPLDADGIDDRLAEHGEVAGVVVCLDRHERDAAALAARHDVPVYVPEWMSGVAGSIDVPVERFADHVGGFRAEALVDNPVWQEAVLFDGDTLVVPEALGTTPYFAAGDRELGVHPLLRPVPPRSLARYDPDRLLLGHGEGVAAGARERVGAALAESRRTAPALYLQTLRETLGL